MSIADWVIVAVLILGSLTSIAMVGRERQPILPTTAVISVILNGALIVWLLASHGVLS